MATWSYQDFLKWFQNLSAQDQQKFRNMNTDSTIAGYLQQYDKSNTVYTPTTTQNTTKSTNYYWDTWGASYATQYKGTWVSSAGDYTYNPNLKTSSLTNGSLSFWTNAESVESRSPWYLEQRNNAIANALYNEWKTDEQSVRNYLNTFADYRNYDTVWQNNTVTAIMKRMWTMWNLANQGKATSWADLNSMIQNEIMDYYNKSKEWYSNLMWGSDNYYTNFRDAVNWKLSNAYWISDLNAFKERYPEQYDTLKQALDNVEWVWNATDPNSRQMLDWVLQSVIWTWVGYGSDMSKINRLEESVLSKFKNPDKIKQDAQNVIKLQTEWKNIKTIANEMWIPEDQVQQLILLANWLDSKAWEYYQLTDNASKDITEPYDTKIARLEEEKKIALDRANRNVDWLKQDYDTNYERQQEQNDINAHNADAIAWRTWLGFSKRGIEWINYVNQQAKNILDDLTKNYDRNNQEMADWIADIIRNWQWNNDDLTKACEDALTKAKNSFTSNMLAIQQQYWTVGLQAQQYLSQNVQSFIEQAENIYDNALVRQQNNLTNLINNVANLNAIASNNLLLRKQRIAQFQSEALNLNRSELQSLANQLWMDTASYQDLVTYQAQAVANELNWYLPWAWIMFQDEISSLLESGANWQEVLQWVMNQPEFKQAQAQANWWSQNWAMSNGIMYNKSTWEYMDLNWNTWNKLNDNTLYNPATWQTMSIDGLSWLTWWVNNMWSQQVIEQWLQNFANQYQLWSTWWQCWAFANKYLESLWLKWVFVDPIEDKKKAINTEEWYVPQVWDIAVMNSPSQPKYWHVAIITWISQDKNWNMVLTTLESNKKNNDWKVFTRTFTPNVSTATEVFWYYHPEVQSNAGSGVGNRNYATDIDQIDTAYERSIKSLIPTKLQDNVEEAKRINAKILKMWNQWLSAEDAVLQYYWFDVKDDNDRNLALSLADTVRQLPDDSNVWTILSYVSQKINNKQYAQAISKVENEVRTQAKKNEPDWYFDESTAMWIVKKANELIQLANSMPKDIWVFQWSMQKYLKKLKSSDASKLNTAIAYLTDEQRLKQVWSNVSEHELEMVKNWIPQIDDRTDTFMNKINQMKENAIANLNAWRTTYWLPALDENTLLNSSDRSWLYNWTYTPVWSTVFTSSWNKISWWRM